MNIDFDGIRYIVNGEPMVDEVLNRAVGDLVELLEAELGDEIIRLAADESVVYAIALG